MAKDFERPEKSKDFRLGSKRSKEIDASRKRKRTGGGCNALMSEDGH